MNRKTVHFALENGILYRFSNQNGSKMQLIHGYSGRKQPQNNPDVVSHSGVKVQVRQWLTFPEAVSQPGNVTYPLRTSSLERNEKKSVTY